jgi:cytochrome b
VVAPVQPRATARLLLIGDRLVNIQRRSTDNPGRPPAPPTLLVWDWGVRVFHWALLAAVLLASGTGFLAPANWLNAHLIGGTAIVALLGFRLVWGWNGSTYARFASFALRAPRIVMHLREIASGRGAGEPGHNPVGAVMVYVLLALLGLISLTGLVVLGGVVKQGPLAGLTSYAVGRQWRGAHEALAIGLLVLIVGHLAGVVFESLRTGENLALAMLTGRKHVRAVPGVVPHRAHPGRAALLCAAIGLVALLGSVRLAALPGLGVPVLAPEPLYARECGSCHLAYPPSLASAASWTTVMAGLTDHFGENAELDAASAAQLRSWLVAHASETADTRVANLMRVADPASPQRITTTPGWRRVHGDVPESLFRAPKVGAKGACAACHEDAATARFDPQAIAVPKETNP